MSTTTHVIAIDGPAGSGKSTTARFVARRLGFVFLDTGAMYRAVTLLALEQRIPLSDGDRLSKIAAALRIKFEDDAQGQRVFADGRDITLEIRTARVTMAVSEVSAHTGVREHMVAMQKQIGRDNNIVAEGRDTTSVVFSEATLKVYLNAALEERAKRRVLDFEKLGKQTTLEEQINDLKTRDEYDSGREISPLTHTPDSVLVDTSGMTIEQHVNALVELFKERISR